MPITSSVLHGTHRQRTSPSRRIRCRRTAAVAATLVVGLAAGCSSDDTVSCTATLGQASSKVTFSIKDGTKAVATLNGYTITFQVTDGGNGLQADLRNPDQSRISTVKTNSTASSGSAPTPDGVLAFECGP